MSENTTLYDELQALYKKYGYYTEKVISVTLPGKDGVAKMKGIMTGLREHAPEALAGLKVLAVRDYLKGERKTVDGQVSKLDTPSSDVLYFELEDNNWVCIRPSGTEPKIKLYVNTKATSAEASAELNKKLAESSQELMK